MISIGWQLQFPILFHNRFPFCPPWYQVFFPTHLSICTPVFPYPSNLKFSSSSHHSFFPSFFLSSSHFLIPPFLPFRFTTIYTFPPPTKHSVPPPHQTFPFPYSSRQSIPFLLSSGILSSTSHSSSPTNTPSLCPVLLCTGNCYVHGGVPKA